MRNFSFFVIHGAEAIIRQLALIVDAHSNELMVMCYLEPVIIYG
jgi:hypothetical protein